MKFRKQSRYHCLPEGHIGANENLEIFPILLPRDINRIFNWLGAREKQIMFGSGGEVNGQQNLQNTSDITFTKRVPCRFVDTKKQWRIAARFQKASHFLLVTNQTLHQTLIRPTRNTRTALKRVERGEVL